MTHLQSAHLGLGKLRLTVPRYAAHEQQQRSEIDRLGRPFEQVCTDPHLAKSGQGLGLALVHALTRKHGGMVAITSREGNGTVVSFAFPATSASAAA